MKVIFMHNPFIGAKNRDLFTDFVHFGSLCTPIKFDKLSFLKSINATLNRAQIEISIFRLNKGA